VGVFAAYFGDALEGGEKVLVGLLCRVADVEASLGMTVHSTACALFCQCF